LSSTSGYLSFHPKAQCVVPALRGLACRARVTLASSLNPMRADYDSSDDERPVLARALSAPAASVAATGSAARAHADLCRFLARVLCSLPFKKEEEALFVISEIGKQLHLHGGYVCIPCHCVIWGISDDFHFLLNAVMF
jgi:hypothetical protein